MTDEIIKVDCQGEGPEFVERATIKKPSDQLRNAWQDGPYGSVVLYAADLIDEQVKTIASLRDDLAEIASLREQLTEAREIIVDLESELVKAAYTAVEMARDEGLTVDAMVLEAAIVSPGEESVIARARAFLTKGETDA
ncbi:MAG TPA: hypothetical protein VFU31_29830 [Candidatus Binatia bacterium]|nr:hypothetical protein [Candidatus Binatia bacterium]